MAPERYSVSNHQLRTVPSHSISFQDGNRSLPELPSYLSHHSLISQSHLPAHALAQYSYLMTKEMILNQGTSLEQPSLSMSILENALNPYSNATLTNRSLFTNDTINHVNYYHNLTSSYISSHSSKMISNSSAANHLVFPEWPSRMPDGPSRQLKRQRDMIDVAVMPSPALVQENSHIYDSSPGASIDFHIQKKPKPFTGDVDPYLRCMIQQLMQSEKLKYSQNQKPMHEAPTPQYSIPIKPFKNNHISQSEKSQPLLGLPCNDQPVSVPRMALTKGGACAQRIMFYLYYQSHRPQNNSFAYWRKIVDEYYAPGAKMRYCFSLYDKVGFHAKGIFCENALGSLQCDNCGSKPRKSLEIAFEALPRFFQRKFENSVKDELICLDYPAESDELPHGNIMLKYDKVVMETIHENLRVVHEGKLQIIFTQDFKIKSWLFCFQRHEEFVPRRVIAPQVNQLLEAAAQCHNDIGRSRSRAELKHALCKSNGIFKAGKQVIMRTLESPTISEVGFSSQIIRFLQVSEVVDSMKDLMAFSTNNHVGPIESLKRYAQSRQTQYEGQEIAPQCQYVGQSQMMYSYSSSERALGSSSLQHNYQKFVPEVGPSFKSVFPLKPNCYGTSGPNFSRTDERSSANSSRLGSVENMSLSTRKPKSSSSSRAQRSSQKQKAKGSGNFSYREAPGEDPFYAALLQVKSEPLEY